MHMVTIVQPWFSAVGHPAQSLINTASVLGKQAGFNYLISVEPDAPRIESSISKLGEHGKVTCFKVSTPSIREGTFKAILQLRKLLENNRDSEQILFFDAHLVMLAGLWPLLVGFKKFSRVGMIYLMGPERILRSRIAGWLVQRFLSYPEAVLYLRTEELQEAWHEAFPSVPQARIRYLPSLEIPDDSLIFPDPTPSEQLKFGIIGQIRRGKGIEYLIPLFQENPQIGALTVAGTFNNLTEREFFPVLLGFPGFLNTFLSEKDMLQKAADQDYLIMLYDDWDSRMESAVLYLAARANRPVVAYNRGWCGRQVGQFHCGLLAPEDRTKLEDFLSGLPHPGDAEYEDLIHGIKKFRASHSGKNAKAAFLKALLE